MSSAAGQMRSWTGPAILSYGFHPFFIDAALMMIAVIGGRIVPTFTRNWLVRRGPGRLPKPPTQRFDKAALLDMLAALALWVASPTGMTSGLALAPAGFLHLSRIARWAGDRTGAAPLVWVLHAGYAILPVCALAVAVLARFGAGFWPEAARALHTLSGLARITAFGGYALLDGPLLLRPRPRN